MAARGISGDGDGKVSGFVRAADAQPQPAANPDEIEIESDLESESNDETGDNLVQNNVSDVRLPDPVVPDAVFGTVKTADSDDIILGAKDRFLQKQK